MLSDEVGAGVVDPREAAREAGLRYVDDSKPGLRRKRNGKGFRYIDPKGAAVRDPDEIARLKSLAIPPAYTDVWICPHPNGHIQATGRDEKGRKQYRYHPRFREAREASKFHRIMAFAEALPGIRQRIDADMGKRGLPREKVLATVVHLLETTLIRVGNDDYARSNKSYGLTTLRDPHVKIAGSEMRFRFKGKSGKEWSVSMRDRRVAKIVKACQDLPGQELFQYLDEDGERRDVTSSDVNAYLREITGEDFTAKDFRTWAGTVLAALALQEFEAFDNAAKAKKNLRAAIESVSSRLGNTPTICRKCYIHPQILDCYLEGGMLLQVKEAVEGELKNGLDALRPEEAAVLSLLRGRLERAAEAAGADSDSPGGTARIEPPRQTGGRRAKGSAAKAPGTKRSAGGRRAA
ncbi:DNA topoisomerase IB [Methylorubrum rhodesianum]|jgi:DNA topoisomerase I|uniref:DNA topoisomerase IB n=1 Tax=Methylorubrum rhodesianum TaxID=29427 RepID=A0ABU9ZAV9_9HYPH|nr:MULTISPECIES: DNA topoisomerase IB [Methylorubrum]MBB5765231.1 DNA topoisomerase-1 [Methylorubrum rhodesianum]MBI1691292.1 DNA topoisomerase IB [Methylorubrum sp. DB1722]MBK3405864.1 DNA topoisomerase IB [Methylorubrum rhodesianum]MBY0143979.1 DNA topoisomerase IB [Methylorubrum populi]